MGEAITSEPQDIPGLDRYLPDSEDRDYFPETGSIPQDPTELLGGEESGREVGAVKEASVAEVEDVLRRVILVKNSGAGHGTGRGGPNEGGGGEEGGSSGGNEEGEGVGERIRTSDIRFRSYIKKSKAGLEYRFIIAGLEECKGAIRIIAVGDDGNYPVNIKTANDEDSGRNYETAGSMIKDLSIAKNKTIRIAVRLSEPDKKYALGIEKYEG
jgi:hypothetical protein